jgi:hypothetical protein
MADLTDEAKAEIAEAIRIVREDKHHSMLRDIHSRTTPKPDTGADPKDPPKDPPADPKPGDPPSVPPPPPANDPPTEQPKKKGLYWGDRIEGE